MTTSASQAQETAQKLIQCVQQGIVETFTMIFDDVQPQGADNVTGEGCNGVIGIISFVGTLPWSMIAAFPCETAVTMMHKFAGFEIPFESADMVDATGELVNIVAGPIIAQLVNIGMEAKMSLPTVARGQGIEILLPSHTQIQRLHFASAPGPFSVTIVTASS
jgi:CheY-specific phosphatase CheX